MSDTTNDIKEIRPVGVPDELLSVIRNSPDSQRYNDVARWLRGFPNEAQRFTYLWNTLAEGDSALPLVRRRLNRQEYFERLLAIGMVVADVSSIQDWLETLAPAMGMKRVLSVLHRHLNVNPFGVYKAVYWIPRLKVSVAPFSADFRKITNDDRFIEIVARSEAGTYLRSTPKYRRQVFRVLHQTATEKWDTIWIEALYGEE